MTPFDYEYLRKLLKDHSGLDLSADKQYLIESRLLPLARKGNAEAQYYVALTTMTSLPTPLRGRLAPYGLILRKNRRIRPATQLVIDVIRSGGAAAQ